MNANKISVVSVHGTDYYEDTNEGKSTKIIVYSKDSCEVLPKFASTIDDTNTICLKEKQKSLKEDRNEVSSKDAIEIIDDLISIISSHYTSDEKEGDIQRRVEIATLENEGRKKRTRSATVTDTQDIFDEKETKPYKSKGILTVKDAGEFAILSFGIIAASVLFAIPWTTIPRIDSIIYQSYWWEKIIPSAGYEVSLNLLGMFLQEI